MVEVIVAFTLFSIITIMLVSIAEFVQYTQRQAIYTNIANQAAQSKITQYQSLGYAAHDVGDSENFTSDTTLKGLPVGKSAVIEVSESGLAHNSKELEVTITYPAAGDTTTVKMKAYVTDGEGS